MAKTGERKAQILQTLAAMLENPKSERITTALLAARLEVSEAALYRHFASKAQMFEGLIEFVEQTVFTLVSKIQSEEKDAMKQIESTVATLLGFAQKNPGMVRVLIGDALVNEDERLQARVNQLLDRLEGADGLGGAILDGDDAWLTGHVVAVTSDGKLGEAAWGRMLLPRVAAERLRGLVSS